MSTPELADVAATYKGALYGGGYPKQAVVKAYDVDASTASRWIKQARDAGLIGDHEKGRPGFVPTAATRKRKAVLDIAEAVAQHWKDAGHFCDDDDPECPVLGELLDALVRAVES